MSQQRALELIRQAKQTNARRLNLSDLKLSELPPEIGDLAELRVLWVANNRLESLPPEIGKLTRLLSLRAENNRLKSLPPEIGELTELRRITLHRNRLTGFPDEFWRLHNLQRLITAGNQLETLADGIGQLTHLQELKFGGWYPKWSQVLGNQLSELPPVIAELKNLQSLDLRNNQLSELPPVIAELKNLQSLDLRNNQLSELPPVIAELKNLQSLYLRNNQLSELPPVIAELKNLQSLDLRNNQLSELPPVIAELKNLQSLYLSGNQLSELPLSLVKLEKLTDVQVNGNPLTAIPPEIVEQGWLAIREYLLESSKQLWMAKMLVVGQGGVGKTSLLRRLRDEGFDPNSETTHGMERNKLPLTHPTLDETMTLITWDFGGQEIYHATHQFFLTKRSLYVVVWSAREGHDQDRLDYWLDKLKALAGDSPVILVATHTEKYSPSIRLAELQEKHQNLITDGDNVFCVSNESGDGIEKLREVIRQTAANMPLMNERWPVKWRAAADAVLKNAAIDKHITANKWRRLLAEHNVAGKAEEVGSLGIAVQASHILWPSYANAARPRRSRLMRRKRLPMLLKP
jgi:Leucine-rich repeat (LRR) protein